LKAIKANTLHYKKEKVGAPFLLKPLNRKRGFVASSPIGDTLDETMLLG